MNNTSFFQIVANSGSIGIMIWLWIFIFSILGIVAGTFSVVNSAAYKTGKYPLALKLLICCIVATLFTGVMGTITGYVDSFAGLATATGSEKASMLRLSLSQSRVSFYFALGAAFLQSIIAGISWGIIQSKSGKIRNIPILTYFLIMISIPVGTGIYFCLWGIEKIVQLKPDEQLPICLGMEFSILMKLCFFSGILGIVLTFLLLIQTTINHLKVTKRRII